MGNICICITSHRFDEGALNNLRMSYFINFLENCFKTCADLFLTINHIVHLIFIVLHLGTLFWGLLLLLVLGIPKDIGRVEHFCSGWL